MNLALSAGSGAGPGALAGMLSRGLPG